jgi:hypothetical protein
LALAESVKEEYDRPFGLLEMAIAQAKCKEREARATFEVAENIGRTLQDRKWLISVAAKQAEAGFGEDALKAGQAMGDPKDLCCLASVFANRSEKEYFRHVLASGTFDMESIGKTCIFGSRIFPEQAVAIAELVNRLYVSTQKAGVLPESNSPDILCSLRF